MIKHPFRAFAGFCALICALTPFMAAAKDIRIAKQLQINNLPAMVVEQRKLFEKHAAALGQPDLAAKWLTFANGGATIDALISGNVDFVSAGLSNFAIVWARTRGDVKGVAAAAGLPLALLTRSPNVKTLKDFTADDRIAVPTVKVSNQAVMLAMGLDKLYGKEGRGKLDQQTVQLAHPDALQALLNPKHEVNSHFSSSPYAELALKSPGIHKVFDSNALFDGPSTNNVIFATTRFHDDNPVAVKALIAAFDEADAFINANKREAAELYLDTSKDKLTVDDVVAIISQPGAIFSTTPTNTLSTVEFMHDSGLIQRRPSGWKDLYFPEMHASSGS
jgi:NitT/TauT family transport system substrate-binding protein